MIVTAALETKCNYSSVSNTGVFALLGCFVESPLASGRLFPPRSSSAIGPPYPRATRLEESVPLVMGIIGADRQSKGIWQPLGDIIRGRGDFAKNQH